MALVVIWGRAFAQLTTIDHSRSRDDYIHDDVLTRTLGVELMSKIIAEVLKAVSELKKVIRGPGQSGELKR